MCPKLPTNNLPSFSFFHIAKESPSLLLVPLMEENERKTFVTIRPASFVTSRPIVNIQTFCQLLVNEKMTFIKTVSSLQTRKNAHVAKQ